MSFIAEPTSRSSGRRSWPRLQSAVSISVTLSAAFAVSFSAAEPVVMIKGRSTSGSSYIVLLCVAVFVLGRTLGFTSGVLRIDAAHAQSAQPNPVERARTAIETLINRLRGRDMPAGIEKANGNIEATQVAVAAKYPGRLATLTVDEGDQVSAGQMVATISSPDTEAQLRAAQAQVLKAKKALAEAVATIAQRKTDLDFTRTDYERGKLLIKNAYISQQMLDLRRNKFETAEAAYVAANAQRAGDEARPTRAGD